MLNEQVVAPQPIRTNMAPVSVAKNISIEPVTQTSATIITTTEPKKSLDATKAQSLSDWTNTIPNLKLSHHFRNDDSWILAQKGKSNVPQVILAGINNNTLQYTADLIDVETRSNQVRRVDLQTPNLNIDETRKLGLELCDLLGIDSKDFLAWCDKVGNQWMDAPVYSNGSKYGAFGVHPTFNNEKPWYINFVITPLLQ